MGVLMILVSLIVTIVTAGYLALKFRYRYWARKGVLYEEPVFPTGIKLKENGKDIHFTNILNNIYKKYRGKTPFAGTFVFLKPVPLITDLDFVHHVMVKDFSVFHDRGVYYNERDDPLSAHLFSLGGKRWKNLRNKLSPTFTSGKMKFMYSTILKVAEEFDATIEKSIEKDSALEIKDINARFTTDVIGTCAFGIECNTLKNPDAEFRNAGKLILARPRNGRFTRALTTSFPSLAVKLGIKTLRDDVTEFFMGAVRETVETREKDDIHRNDFMDLLIEMKNTDDPSGNLERLTLEQIAAQCFLFFLAGFETSSTAMTFSLYELAMNPDIQDRVRQEINDVLGKYNGEFTYEAMMNMPYLDCIIYETLRKHPPLVSLVRVSTEDYVVPGTNVTLKKGTRMIVPVYPIHHDPEIYPDPDVFDPNRFTAEEKSKRHPMAFLGFGDGPRICIGQRFGMMQARVGLVTLLKKYRFKPCDKTMNPMQYDDWSPVLAPKGGMWLHVEKL